MMILEEIGYGAVLPPGDAAHVEANARGRAAPAAAPGAPVGAAEIQARQVQVELTIRRHPILVGRGGGRGGGGGLGKKEGIEGARRGGR